MAKILKIGMFFTWFTLAAMASHSFAKPVDPASPQYQDFRKWQTEINNKNYLTLDYTNQFHKKSLRKNISDNPRLSEGKAYFAKPNKFRWDIRTHDKSLIYDGSLLYQYFTKENTATQLDGAYDLKKITDIVLSFDSLVEHYDITDIKDEPSKMVITLVPRKPTDITQALITIDKAGKYLSVIQLVYDKNSYSVISFSNPKFSAIPNAQFTLPTSVKSVKKL